MVQISYFHNYHFHHRMLFNTTLYIIWEGNDAVVKTFMTEFWLNALLFKSLSPHGQKWPYCSWRNTQLSKCTKCERDIRLLSGQQLTINHVVWKYELPALNFRKDFLRNLWDLSNPVQLLLGLTGSSSRLNQSSNISSFVTLRRGLTTTSLKVGSQKKSWKCLLRGRGT